MSQTSLPLEPPAIARARMWRAMFTAQQRRHYSGNVRVGDCGGHATDDDISKRSVYRIFDAAPRHRRQPLTWLPCDQLSRSGSAMRFPRADKHAPPRPFEEAVDSRVLGCFCKKRRGTPRPACPNQSSERARLSLAMNRQFPVRLLVDNDQRPAVRRPNHLPCEVCRAGYSTVLPGSTNKGVRTRRAL
jgi:hypothetical protein